MLFKLRDIVSVLWRSKRHDAVVYGVSPASTSREAQHVDISYFAGGRIERISCENFEKRGLRLTGKEYPEIMVAYMGTQYKAWLVGDSKRGATVIYCDGQWRETEVPIGRITNGWACSEVAPPGDNDCVDEGPLPGGAIRGEKRKKDPRSTSPAPPARSSSSPKCAWHRG